MDSANAAKAQTDLSTVIGENGAPLAGRGVEHVPEALPDGLSVSRYNALGNRELGRPVDADQAVWLAFSGLHLGHVDLEKPNRISLELLALGLVALDVPQARDAVSLKARPAMSRWTNSAPTLRRHTRCSTS